MNFNNSQQESFSVAIPSNKIQLILNSELFQKLKEVDVEKTKELGFSALNLNDLHLLSDILNLLNNLAKTGLHFVDSISVQSQYLPLFQEIFVICADEVKTESLTVNRSDKFSFLYPKDLKDKVAKGVSITGEEAWIAKSQGYAVEYNLSNLGWAELSDTEFKNWATERFVDAEKLHYEFRIKDTVAP